MASALCLAMGDNAAWFAMSGSHKIARLGGVVALGVFAYFGTLALLGFRLADFKHRTVA
jgi:putative peptidoglycan lipid II flippase